ncbi:MAG TPA: hypothetical protein VNT20_00690 [Flavisolibacter sp.]|jgi:hypothetical protein|nr:hypothetical protein [Flavisolibacter sp.]
MDAFFTIKNKYVVHDSVDKISSELSNILDRRWYDFSENILGRLNEDGTFKLSPKWTLGSLKVFGMLQDMTYLIGALKKEDDKTIIETTTRPNYALIVAFYFPLLLLLAKLFGFDIFIEGTLTQLLLVIPAVCFVLAVIMAFSVVRLRNRFERLMQLEHLD